jgi:hypothetical protein
MARIKTTQQKATGPRGVPRNHLAPRHKGSNSGINDPIGDLEVRVERLTMELRHGSRERACDRRRIAELSSKVPFAAGDCGTRYCYRLGYKFMIYSLGLRGDCPSPDGRAKHSPGKSASV